MYTITHIENTYSQSFFHVFTHVHKAAGTTKQTTYKNRQHGNLLSQEH